ncbi:protein Bouncer [Esox lucius]|uniref:protein Bouncer n=1 Tax=Esox lucius TaxID=8010 RepID=UPI000577B57B|nr:protein Bouncer [Esox lucius]
MGSPQVFLSPALLGLALLLPAILCNDNLLCYYSPVMYRNKTFDLILSECPPTELCMKAHGRYGNHSALSSRGCVERSDCGRAHALRIRGTVYTMTYACCDYNYCNAGCRVAVKSLPFAVAIMSLLLIGL